MNLEILKFLEEEVPNTIEDIRESLDLVSISLENALEQIGKKVEKFFSDKQYTKVSELSLKSEEVEKINKEVQNIINELDNIINKGNTKIDNKNISIKDEKEIPNYNKYLVDNKVEHTLHEDYTHKRPVGFSIENNYIEANEWKNVLLETLNYLVEKDKNIIINFVNDKSMNGKKVTYFASNEKDIARSPKKIKNVNIFVETNQSANLIRNLIVKILNKYHINLSKFKIFLRADYSELH